MLAQFEMEIKLLSDNLKTRVSSEVKITNFLHCVTELVYNSLDGKATAIAVRINTLTFQLQVIDNGDGITQENMGLIGQRYMTNKCSSLSHLNKRCRYYGYKGESLASIRELSRILSITSRSGQGQGETFYKIFSGNESQVRVHKVKQRSSKGTTVNIEGFLYNNPVRQKRINPEIELDEIKKFLQAVAIIHPDVSLTLRNELTGCVVLQNPKSKTVSNAIINLCVNLDRNCLHEIKVKKHSVSVSGLIYSKSHVNNKLQFIYVNKRLTDLKNLRQVINRTIELKLFKDDVDQMRHPVYVLNIGCPRFDFDCSQFKNWEVLLKCVEKLIGQVSTDSVKKVKRRSLSETDIKACDASSRHMSKKMRSDNTLEVKTKGSKTDAKEEKSNESCGSNFLCFQKCNLVGGKSKKAMRQTQFEEQENQKWPEIKKKGCECIHFESKDESNEMQLETVNNILQASQKQKRNPSQDFIDFEGNRPNLILCGSERNKTQFEDQSRGKGFIMDKFMKSLSIKDDSEYNILRDVSFVNEKGAKRLEKLNREANLMITNHLGNLNDDALLQEQSKASDNDIQERNVDVFYNSIMPYLCENLNHSDKQITPPSRTQEQSKASDNDNQERNAHILYNSIMPYLCEGKEPHLPFEESSSFPNEKESTYKSHCNNFFLPDLSSRNENSELDMKERFYQTIIKTCKSAKLDDLSRFFTCKGDYTLSEDEYEKFKRDLDAYMLQQTPGALLNKTFIFKDNRKSKSDRSFHLNINFTGIYRDERLFEASEMSLFYASRRVGDWKLKSSADNATKNFVPDDKRNRNISAVKSINVNQTLSENNSLFLVSTNDLNIVGEGIDERKDPEENLDLNPEAKIEKLFMDTSVQANLTSQDIKSGKKDSSRKENIETGEGNLGFQLVTEWIKQEESGAKIYYLNTRTGMSSSLNRQSPSRFTLKKRPQYIPKGLSPIVKHVKEVDTSLPPSAKGKLQNAIIEVYDNDLEIIKNSSAHIEDLQDFLDKYYEENQKKFGSVTLNAYNKNVSHEMYTFTRNLFEELQIIGQFDLKFIVTHSSSGVIFLFDQHAVGERIQLERLLKDYTEASSMKYKSTRCKEFVIKFTSEDVCLISNFKHMFEYLGLCFEALEDLLLIKKVPLCFYNKSDKTVNNHDTLSCLVQNLIHEELILLRSTRGNFSKIPSCIRDVINSEACRGAVKFGDELSPSDCHNHIKELSRCQLPFHCAHGRPTVIPLVKLRDAKENLFNRLAAPNLKKLVNA